MANQYNMINDLDKTDIYINSKCNTPKECSLDIGDAKSQLTIVCQNIRSIHKNFDNFSVFLSELDFLPDIIVLTECRLSESTPLVYLNNYVCHYSKSYLNQNDGIAVLYRNNLQVTIEEPSFREANCLLIHIAKIYTICAIYRSPSFYNINNFCESLEIIMQGCNSPNCIIMGDINIDISPDSKDRRASDYLDATGHYGFYPGHHYPTHDRTCLDHVLIKSKKAVKVVMCRSGITDHDTVVTGIAKEFSYSQPNSKSKIKIDYTNLSKAIESINWNSLYMNNEVNKAFDDFIGTLSSTIQKYTTAETSRNSKSIRKPWMTKGLIRCIRKRDLLHKESSKKYNKDNYTIQQQYKNYRNLCNNLIQNLKNEYDRKTLEDTKGDSKKTWSAIKRICNIKKDMMNNLELLHACPDTKKSLDRANKFFTSVGEELAAKTLSNFNKTESELALITSSLYLNSSPSSSFYANPTDNYEVDKIISNLKDASAPGWDGIPNKILKLNKSHLIPPIVFLCNLSISSGIVPTSLKTANVCPIFKSGDKTAVSNYRPISLLTSLSKILEKIMNTRLLGYLERNGILSDNQYGFRKNRSTEDAVTDIVDFVVTKLDNGNKCTGIFLDLAKAFDTVSRSILLRKLEGIGIRGIALEWFQSYLSNRTQRVILGNNYSSYANLKYGVPQGSVLGPTLFIIYVNSLCSLTLCKAKIFAYADDTAIVFYDRTWELVYKAAESGVSQIAQWLNYNLLTLNVDKTKVINFSVCARNACPSHLAIKLHTCHGGPDSDCSCPCFEQVAHIKYLGVYIDKNLTWTKQIEHVSGRVRKLLHVFKRMGQIANTKVLKMIYDTLCESLLSYCIVAWGAALKTHLIKAERAQRAVLKVAYKKPRRFPTKTLYQVTGAMSVRQIYIIAVTLRFHKEALLKVESKIHCRRGPGWHKPKRRLDFGKRCFQYMGPLLYSKLNVKLNLIPMTKTKCKSHIKTYLKDLDYDDTEKLLNIY
ncbi:hypothetical protein PYW07_011538 [Mythimna separata]|uniref:Reverse transcriptase domain-containing protein n=1 Tax=Mythimna separata TaxID=271217 RepID=A0AAD7Y9I8_MYTSE|nr:hypothetical protein PYW07_011538 [Mythimna separata]